MKGNIDNYKGLNFKRALDNIIIPLPELIGSCVTAKAMLTDLLTGTEDDDNIEDINFISFVITLCADFFSDALEESNSRLTAARRTRDLAIFREYIKNIINENK